MREKADSDLVRRQNRLLLMEALRQHGTLARVDMGRHTGLSPASITSISSSPMLPPSPACGFRPVTAMRGLATPALRRARSMMYTASLTAGPVMRAATSLSGTCEVTREVHNAPVMLNSHTKLRTPS